ncbi:MAG: hypothetical protein ICCCNLDF_01643 [Planctomycetes bacterium]|nr:hypothetical protein [Planctomycetota bacterium]
MANAIDTKQLLGLSSEERLKLLMLLWNSLVEEGKAPGVSEAALDEAERRATELKANPELGIGLDELRKQRGWK